MLSEFDETRVYGGVEESLSSCGGVECTVDVLAAGVFGEVAEGTGGESGGDRLVVAEGGKHDDTGCRVVLVDAAGRFDAVHPGHAQVHQHDVGGVLLDQSKGFLSVTCGADDIDVRQTLADGHKAVADERLVIDDDELHVRTSA